MPHADGHWVESKVNPGWYYGFGKNNPNPINQPAPEPGMTPNITNQTEYNRNLNSGRGRNRNAAYKVYGTNEPYSGMTVEVGGYLYSTVGGALEGNSMQLIATVGSNSNVNTNQMSNTQNDNPVTRTFISRVVYYRQDGTVVPSGSELHEHADGTIMLGHDPNNMGEIVTRTRPSTRTRTRTQTSNGRRTQTRTRTSGGGMSGGGRSGY